MPQQGTVTQWNEDKGYGFIRADTAQPVFFHVRDYRAPDGPPPRIGLAVRFELIHVGGKGPRAMAVTPVTATVAPPVRRRRSDGPPRRAAAGRGGPPDHGSASTGFAWALMAAWSGLLAWGWWQHRLPGPGLAVLVPLNLATFWAYWADKAAAERGAWRTAESSLHLLALVGGWPGAWWAQRLLRHKTVKVRFQQVYWGTVALHFAALVGWLSGLAPAVPAAR